jgi:glycosyltransferase involved in cell wall biosynthesis
VVVAFSRSPLFINHKSYSVNLVSITGNGIIRQLRLLTAIVQAARKADIIYAQGTIVVGAASLIVSKLLQKKLIIKFVGDEIWEAAYNSGKTDKLLEAFYSFINRKSSIVNLHILLHRLVLRQASTIIVPSQYLKTFLTHAHRIEANQIVIIPNAIEPLAKVPQKNPHQYIVVGRLAKTKHVDLIINAFIKANIPKSKLLIVGDGPEKLI